MYQVQNVASFISSFYILHALCQLKQMLQLLNWQCGFQDRFANYTVTA